MPIVGVPGWIGSSAVSVTGQRWMSAARTAVRLSAAGAMSQLAGKSKEVNYSIGASNSYNKDTLINYLRSQGSTPVVVTITGNLVSSSSAAACLEFPSNLPNEYVHLIINSGAGVYGRGGNGGTKGHPSGYNGGPGITNSMGTKLRVTNNGTIAGGGGGGGGVNLGSGQPYRAGGGGAPYGTGGTGSTGTASSATFTTGGAGHSTQGKSGGRGGDIAKAGSQGDAGGSLSPQVAGAAGAAVNGNAPTWNKKGTINGSSV
ncbi:receptor-recognizing protein [Pseudocitrobacter faecalis]|uniref:receptor-recognizing protein n=1 Tax=Pseudocitrobacter faecalis TaxID=1398493 RepID=UPI003B9EDA9F